MHSIKGKCLRALDATAVAAWAASYREVVLDLGTGDGRFVRDLARRCPAMAAIGVDTCQANVRDLSRTAPDNALFIVADALALPVELQRLATAVTINFPWGSLLRGLLDGNAGLLVDLATAGRASCSLDVRLNAGALAEDGWSLDAGGEQVAHALDQTGFAVHSLNLMGSDRLRTYPTTWAKRLAFGRDPRAVEIRASR